MKLVSKIGLSDEQGNQIRRIMGGTLEVYETSLKELIDERMNELYYEVREESITKMKEELIRFEPSLESAVENSSIEELYEEIERKKDLASHSQACKSFH